MPTITIRANHEGDTGHETLTERVVAAHLLDEHYVAQLIERLAWAAIDAEDLEVASQHANTSQPDGVEQGPNRGHVGAGGRERTRSYTLPRVSYLGPRA